MVSTVKSRPNHYEMLGLKPTASDEEIAQAFARAMGGFRPMADAAQIGIAFAILRDPIKRRDYDRSLVLAGEPEIPRSASAVSEARPAPFMVSAAARPAGPATVSMTSLPDRHAATQTQPQEPAGPEHSLPNAGVPVASQPVAVRLEQLIPDFPVVRGSRRQSSSEAEDGGIDWKYPAFAIGGLVLAVGVLGAWAGMAAGGEADAAQAALTVPLPPAKTDRSGVQSPALSAAAAVKAESSRMAPVSLVPERIRRAPSRPRRPEDRLSGIGEALASAAPETAAVSTEADQAVAAAGPSLAAAARLPLPNSVVARTIERIGYSCGEVSSAVQADAPGVYRVTCTSGHSYRATPVGGRYRFKRLGSR